MGDNDRGRRFAVRIPKYGGISRRTVFLHALFCEIVTLILVRLATSGVVPRSLNRVVLRIIASTVDTTAKACRHKSYRRLGRHARQTPFPRG